MDQASQIAGPQSKERDLHIASKVTIWITRKTRNGAKFQYMPGKVNKATLSAGLGKGEPYQWPGFKSTAKQI